MGLNNDNSRPCFYLAALVLVIASFINLSHLGTHPLFDWDEATYGRVAEATLAHGDWLSLSDLGGPWFEKPPLYIWLTMASMKFFGVSEFSVRLPSTLFTIAAILLLYFLALELTGNAWLSFFASMILLFTEPFFMFGSRSTRMDSAVVATILFAAISLIKGLKKERWLIGIGLCIGIGVMLKSVIGLLAIVPVLILSALFKHQEWLKNKFFRNGIYLMLLIVVPWHLYQSYRFGSAFWDVYFLSHVVDRAFRSWQTAHYFRDLWNYVQPWTALSLALIVPILFSKTKDQTKTAAWFGLLSATSLIFLFEIAKTKIWWYLLPAFPFIALFAAAGLFYVWECLLRFNTKYLIIACAVFVALGAKITITDGFTGVWQHNPYLDDEKNIGILLRQNNGAQKIFICCWDPQESIRFYGKQPLVNVSQTEKASAEPYYFIIPTRSLADLYRNNPSYATAKVVYNGKFLTLFYATPSANAVK